jgi:hypothetical protein
MGTQTKEETIDKDDILFYKLHKVLAEWAGVEPMEYQKYINQLLPVEKDDRVLFALRPIDIEIQCLYTATMKWLGDNEASVDTYTGSALGYVLHALKTCSFVAASRKRKMVDGESMHWAIRRKANQAWFIEVPSSDSAKMIDRLRDVLEGR